MTSASEAASTRLRAVSAETSGWRRPVRGRPPPARLRGRRTAHARQPPRGRAREPPAPPGCMDTSRQGVTAASHGCRSATPSVRAPPRACSSFRAGVVGVVVEAPVARSAVVAAAIGGVKRFALSSAKPGLPCLGDGLGAIDDFGWSMRARSVGLARPQGGSCGSVRREQRVEFAPEPGVEPALAVDGPGDPCTAVGRLDALREP